MNTSQPVTTATRREPRKRTAFIGTSFLWLPVVAMLLLFANGRNNVAIAAWLAPVFLLRFLRGGNLGAYRPRT